MDTTASYPDVSMFCTRIKKKRYEKIFALLMSMLGGIQNYLNGVAVHIHNERAVIDLYD